LLAGCCCCRAGHAERNLLHPHLFFVCADYSIAASRQCFLRISHLHTPLNPLCPAR
jgi:hypothetical protein